MSEGLDKLKNGVICIGEALIDFTPTDRTNLIYEKCPGGAPANVAVGLSRFGINSSFVGKVGDDILGRFLEETLENEGVNTSEMVATREAPTGLTFVSLDENGERSFQFYINSSADQFLSVDEVNEASFRNQKILHIGSISMIHERSTRATKKAIQISKENGLWLSFDPNLRLSLWETPELAHERITSVLPQTDILKVSEDELLFITGQKKIRQAIQTIKKVYNISLVLVTLGAKGSIALLNETIIEVPGIKIRSVDTTGAGDAFVAGILYGLNQFEKDLPSLKQKEIFDIVRFANVSGAIMASKKGVMKVLPSLEAIEELMV